MTGKGSALEIVEAVYAGAMHGLPSRSTKLDAAPRILSVRLLVWAIYAAAAAESVVPSALPRAVRQVMAS